MQSIQSLGISGFRGYSPETHQKIEFIKPLTLIWGKNGSGKTTIIQCLKFITTGALPPYSDKGKSFVMDPKIVGQSSVMGDVRLKFRTGSGRMVVAKRKVSLTISGKASKFESLGQVLTTKDDTGKQVTINHQCAEIQKQVPQFIGISKPVLQNIVFCHQDESLWPFGDNNTLKSIFDELLETKQFTKIMETIWDERVQQVNALKNLKIHLEYLKNSNKRIISNHSKAIDQLMELSQEYSRLEKLRWRIESMQKQLEDDQQAIIQRERYIQQKGSTQESIRMCQQNMLNLRKLMRQTQEKYNRQRQRGFQIQSNNNHINHHNGHNFSNKLNELDQLDELGQIQLVKNIQQTQKKIQQKKMFVKQMKIKFQSIKDQIQSMKSLQQMSKRQRQIQSEIARIKQLLPDLKKQRNTNHQDFLLLLKKRIEQMQKLSKGIYTSKIRLQKMEVPSIIETGFSQSQFAQWKQQLNKVKDQIRQMSFDLLNVYKLQYQKLPTENNKPSFSSSSTQSKSFNPQNQLKQILAVIDSKEKQLSYYQNSLNKKQECEHNNKQKPLKSQIFQMQYIGIELQDKMLHFCQKKSKCYFCYKKISDKQYADIKTRVERNKQKVEQTINQLKQKQQQQQQQTSQQQHNEIDPQAMVNKLKIDLQKLFNKKNNLQTKCQEYRKQILLNNQRNKNIILQKQFQKCNLSLLMLQKLKLSYEQRKSQNEYKSMPIEQFVALSSKYQVCKEIYKSLRDKLTQKENVEKHNQKILLERQQIITQKNQLRQAIQKDQQQIKYYEMAKNISNKLSSLIRMKKSSKSKNDNYSQSSQFNSVEQGQNHSRNLRQNIINDQHIIQKLQIRMKYTHLYQIKRIKAQTYSQIIQNIHKLDSVLNSSKALLNKYNNDKLDYSKEIYGLNMKFAAVQSVLNTPLQKEYMQKVREKKALQESIADLDTVYYGLEDSINLFHSEKMDEINKIIYEVWRQIYHGDDIEYIEIQAQTEKDGKRKKKNYQYRILMKKSLLKGGSSQKVQMKGRCSMGQKVLASIVIRLALAEVFTNHTRILALDQPTTNLDRQHIRNLALELMKLIQMTGGKNLELIIISHDIEFIKMLQDYAEDFYEVSRNQNKFSVINKKSMRDLISNLS